MCHVKERFTSHPCLPANFCLGVFHLRSQLDLLKPRSPNAVKENGQSHEKMSQSCQGSIGSWKKTTRTHPSPNLLTLLRWMDIYIYIYIDDGKWNTHISRLVTLWMPLAVLGGWTRMLRYLYLFSTCNSLHAPSFVLFSFVPVATCCRIKYKSSSTKNGCSTQLAIL